MNGLKEFLTPFSHLVFANRNIVIVLLCVALFVITLDALIQRYRTGRLERDLSSSRSSAGSTSIGRRSYATNSGPESPVAETGALPPVKGGRTYARNLGSALQKAGISGQQIYSPPTPAGWAPNPNPQPGMPQPGQAPAPYATPNVPWTTPASPSPSPWGYPAGAGRPVPPVGPPGAPPFYQPQPAPLQPPPAPAQSMPAVYTPPTPASFGPPPLYTPPNAAPAPVPPVGAPGMFGVPPVAPVPGFGIPAPIPAQSSESAAQDVGRRGKPKRRRFSFSVLENLEKNLEKFVQPKSAEPVSTSTWTPPAAPPPALTVASAGAATAPAAPSAAPAVPEPGPTAEPAGEAETLPLRFGLPAEPAVTSSGATEAREGEQEAAALDEPATEPEAPPEPESVASAPEPESPPVTYAPAPEPEPEPETKRSARRSMRSMLFGTEPEPAPKAEPALNEQEPVSAEPSWTSSRWAPAEETPTAGAEHEAPAGEAEGTTTEAEAPVAESETPEEPSMAAEPVAEASAESQPAPEPWQPWSARRSEPEAAATVESGEAPSAEEPPPLADSADRPSAGTLVIIEDDHTAASYYATLFRGNGYQVEVANDGVSGVDLCARVQPQVILLDVMMPRQNGILVLQTLRASDETKNTPVVVMSNFSEPTLIKRALQLGALEYVIKTQVEGPALLNALPRWMNREKAFAAA